MLAPPAEGTGPAKGRTPRSASCSVAAAVWACSPPGTPKRKAANSGGRWRKPSPGHQVGQRELVSHSEEGERKKGENKKGRHFLGETRREVGKSGRKTGRAETGTVKREKVGQVYRIMVGAPPGLPLGE